MAFDDENVKKPGLKETRKALDSDYISKCLQVTGMAAEDLEKQPFGYSNTIQRDYAGESLVVLSSRNRMTTGSVYEAVQVVDDTLNQLVYRQWRFVHDYPDRKMTTTGVDVFHEGEWESRLEKLVKESPTTKKD